MRINVHAHVFNLRSVLSREAVEILIRRLRDYGAPDLVVNPVRDLLLELHARPEVLDERELLVRLLRRIRGASGFEAFAAERLRGLPVNVVIRGDGLETLSVEALRQALDQLSTALAPMEGWAGRLFDLVETLRLCMRGTITEVADVLLEQMEPEDALVALMMDIRAPEEPERDRTNFLRQIEGTREAVLQRPGRILPFFAVHPDRADHFALMEEAIGSGAFVGVKLYPSLGYPVDGPALMDVYRYCVEKEVPVLLHCSHGGFYRDRDSINFCDPARWEPVIGGELEELRVCFAHFGGWDALGRPDGLDEGTWGGRIHRLMRERPFVYTDLAFHTDQMHDPVDEAHYFRRLSEMLEDERLQRRILFGTDSWLLRLEMTEALFWAYYREKMPAEEFEKIAGAGPRSFLGFPEAAGEAPRANLRRHLEFLVRHREEVGAEPAGWVRELTDQPFEVEREAANWGSHRAPSRCVFQWAKPHMSSAQKRGGYAGNATTRLRELGYFRPRDPNFGMICAGMTQRLGARCLRDARGFSPGWDTGTAASRLEEVFRRGEKELLELAALVDLIFDFDDGLV